MDVTTPVCKQPPTLMSLSSRVIREAKLVLSLGAGTFKIWIWAKKILKVWEIQWDPQMCLLPKKSSIRKNYVIKKENPQGAGDSQKRWADAREPQTPQQPWAPKVFKLCQVTSVKFPNSVVTELFRPEMKLPVFSFLPRSLRTVSTLWFAIITCCVECYRTALLRQCISDPHRLLYLAFCLQLPAKTDALLSERDKQTLGDVVTNLGMMALQNGISRCEII